MLGGRTGCGNRTLVLPRPYYRIIHTQCRSEARSLNNPTSYKDF
jgi:hypothetical protein